MAVAGLSVLAHMPTPPADSSSSHHRGRESDLAFSFHSSLHSSILLGSGSSARLGRCLSILTRRVLLTNRREIFVVTLTRAGVDSPFFLDDCGLYKFLPSCREDCFLMHTVLGDSPLVVHPHTESHSLPFSRTGVLRWFSSRRERVKSWLSLRISGTGAIHARDCAPVCSTLVSVNDGEPVLFPSLSV